MASPVTSAVVAEPPIGLGTVAAADHEEPASLEYSIAFAVSGSAELAAVQATCADAFPAVAVGFVGG